MDGYPQDNRNPYSYAGKNKSPSRWAQNPSRIPKDRGKAARGTDLRPYVDGNQKSPGTDK